MELIGTFALCYVGGTAVSAEVPLSQVAIAHGFILCFMIYAGAHISGAHFNPAVTVGLISIKAFEPVIGGIYILFQLLGAIIAGVVVSLLSDSPSDCGCPGGVSSEYTLWQGVVMETLATWFLMFVIMATAVDNRAPNGVFGIAIGGTLTMCICGIGPATGGALNPWRYYGPKLGALAVDGGWSGDNVGLYLSPFLGALIAAQMYQKLFLDEAMLLEKEDCDGNV